jgi:hypothetical protein
VVFGEEAFGVRHDRHGAAERLGEIAERIDRAIRGPEMRPSD